MRDLLAALKYSVENYSDIIQTTLGGSLHTLQQALFNLSLINKLPFQTPQVQHLLL